MPVDEPPVDEVGRARGLAQRLLRETPERWEHAQGVAARAVELAVTVHVAERATLVAAAWLHDIGYSPTIKRTGYHPLDGGLYLREHDWDPRLTALVAHHSGARFVPAERGLADLMAQFGFQESPLSDALTYADQTVGRHGARMDIYFRIGEAITRHGPGSPNARGRIERIPYLLAVAGRVEKRLDEGFTAERAGG